MWFTCRSMQGGNSILRGVVNGWEVSGMTQIESGANLTSGPSGWNFGYSSRLGSTIRVATGKQHLRCWARRISR